jgi:hypothetical protein
MYFEDPKDLRSLDSKKARHAFESIAVFEVDDTKVNE